MTVSETFYGHLRQDFALNRGSSFLCRQLGREKENAFRLRLKRACARLREDGAEAPACARLLVAGLLEEPSLRTLCPRLKSLPAFLQDGGEGPFPARLRACLDRLEAGLCPDRQAVLALAGEVLRLCPAPSGRGDAYAQLQERRLDLQAGALSQADCLRADLALLARKARLRIPAEALQALWDYGRRLGGPEGFQGPRAPRCRRLLALLERPDPPPMDPAALDRFHQALSAALLEADARTFLYDAARSGETRDRKKDRSMAFLDAYCASFGLALLPAAGSQERADCQALFDALRRDRRRTKVLIPLRLDAASGAGLYILGRDFFPQGAERGRDACGLAGIFFNGLTGDGMMDCDVSLLPPDLDEALKWYEQACREEALELYRAYNGSPPPGCPSAFLRYFEEPDEAFALLPDELRQYGEAFLRQEEDYLSSAPKP